MAAAGWPPRRPRRTVAARHGHPCRSLGAARKDPPRRHPRRADGRGGFAAAQIGKINVTDFHSYVAVERGIAREGVKRLSQGKPKGRKVKARRLADLAD